MMIAVTDNIDEVRSRVEEARSRGRIVGCVPTMGNLHDGHLSLVRRAREECGFVVATIFVNPTQFSPTEDYREYPRTLEADHEACHECGVDLIFEPAVDTMYPGDELTSVRVNQITDHLCGPFRPGHFTGVATVVHKLLNIVQPQRAYFGWKDCQQLAVIERMCRDLNMPVEIVGCPTIREASGLALSSRNVYLSDAQRIQAASLYRSLTWAREQVKQARTDAADIEAGIRRMIEEAGPCDIQYVTVVDRDTFQPVSEIKTPCLAALAVVIGPARLIDNIPIDGPDARA
jgi:pantoate--beta-alanine ligase